METIKNKSLNIDFLRLVAIFCVVLAHVSCKLLFRYPNISDQQVFISFVYNTGCRIAIPVFLMLTGMLLLNKDENINVFLKKRLFKIIPVFIMWNVIYAWYVSSINESITFIELMFKSISEPIFYHLWYIYVLIPIYILTPFFRVINININKKYIKYFLLITFGLIFLNNILFKFFNFEIGIKLDIGVELLYFILGGYLINIYKCFKNQYINFILFIVMTLTMIYGNYYLTCQTHTLDTYFSGFSNILNFLQSIYFIVFILNLNRVFKIIPIKVKYIIKILSMNTLGIYFVHALVIEIIFKFFSHILEILPYSYSIFIVSVIIFIISFFISMGLDFIIHLYVYNLNKIKHNKDKELV